jgi:PleD family two-component response regulator
METQDKIGMIVDDMMFASKIRGAATASGREVDRVRSHEQIESDVAANPPHLLIIDLNADRLDPIETIALLKSRPELSAIPLVGFFSHVDVELKRRAEEAGCDYVVPRSLFTQRLGDIVSGRLEGLPRR